MANAQRVVDGGPHIIILTMKTIDSLIKNIDRALKTVSGISNANRSAPSAEIAENSELSQLERRHAAGLMRVNHVGEVCAQALYDAQAKFAKSPALREQFIAAGKEEEDHLAWTAERLKELGASTSLLNPLWYGGAYVMGALAAIAGDDKSLGFVVETERQVEAHLMHHLITLPQDDLKSRAIVEQMRLDEIEHGAAAQALGAAAVPKPLQHLMQTVAKVMTTTAYYI